MQPINCHLTPLEHQRMFRECALKYSQARSSLFAMLLINLIFSVFSFLMVMKQTSALTLKGMPATVVLIGAFATTAHYLFKNRLIDLVSGPLNEVPEITLPEICWLVIVANLVNLATLTPSTNIMVIEIALLLVYCLFFTLIARANNNASTIQRKLSALTFATKADIEQLAVCEKHQHIQDEIYTVKNRDLPLMKGEVVTFLLTCADADNVLARSSLLQSNPIEAT